MCFNNAVDGFELEKLKMSSPRIFPETIAKCGEKAVIAKSDIKDAYKLIPNAKEQWRLYGFEWLGKLFLTVKWSLAAKLHQPILPETIVNIVCCLENVPKGYVHRQLDDVPVHVSPKIAQKFENHRKICGTVQKICKELGVPLAEDCPNQRVIIYKEWNREFWWSSRRQL